MSGLRKTVTHSGRIAQRCLYGENPWQSPAGLYRGRGRSLIAVRNYVLVEGTPMSYNNIVDLDRMLYTMTHAIAGLRAHGAEVHVALAGKHGNCAGGAYRTHAYSEFERCVLGDPIATDLGSVVLASDYVDEGQAELLVRKGGRDTRKFDVMAAQGFSLSAVEVFRRKAGKCRVLQHIRAASLGDWQVPKGRRIRYLMDGDFLVQPEYSFVLDLNAPYVVCEQRVRRELELDLVFAWAIGSTSNSNTITLVKDGKLIANAVGQQDRLLAATLAELRASRAKHAIRGAVAYSDSFFPFDDGPKVLIDAGVQAILTSSGSVRDKDTIAACKAAGVALYMVPDKLCRGFFGH